MKLAANLKQKCTTPGLTKDKNDQGLLDCEQVFMTPTGFGMSA